MRALKGRGFTRCGKVAVSKGRDFSPAGNYPRRTHFFPQTLQPRHKSYLIEWALALEGHANGALAASPKNKVEKVGVFFRPEKVSVN
jgi:hypothetical protein